MKQQPIRRRCIPKGDQVSAIENELFYADNTYMVYGNSHLSDLVGMNRHSRTKHSETEQGEQDDREPQDVFL